MVLDPFTALGLAGNIVQFIDFTAKLISETRAIYQAADGASEKNRALRIIAEDLSQLTNNLIISAARGTNFVGPELRNIAFECKSVADELQTALSKLQQTGRRTVWKSFLVALQDVWKIDKIAGMTGRLDALQRELNTHLLGALLNQQHEIRMTLDAIEDQNRRFEMNHVQELQSLKQQVLAAVSGLRSESKLQSVTVKEYFKSLTTFQLNQGAADQTKLEHRFSKPINTSDVTLLSNRMNQLSTAMKELSQKSRSVASEQTLLKALAFPNMRQRRDNVKAAHSETFEWIFKPDSRDSSVPRLFVQWLEQEHGCYWISGKAGSGKSTLMKFLFNHPETRKHLRTWAGTKQLITAEYFFWNGGTRLQKSQEGLLRSLLFELLRQCPELIPLVCRKLEQYVPYLASPDDWTREELLEAFDRLKQEGTVSARFCFFIDGMDEYEASDDGGYVELAQILIGISSCMDIKIYLSSRPWTEFNDAFAKPDHYLELQDLTKNDIALFVRDYFEQSPYFRQALAHDPQYQGLVAEIVSTAKGVFLWVFLVARSLLQGLQNSDRVSDLQKRLRQIPPTLEKFFKAMFDSVDEAYDEMLPKQLQFALEAQEPDRIMRLWCLDMEDADPDYALKSSIKPLTPKDISYIEDSMKRRIHARCKGLLEIHKENNWLFPVLDYRVDFLHRTVRGFLLTAHMQKVMKEKLPSNFHPKLSFCKAVVQQLKTLPSSKTAHWKVYGLELIENIVFYGTLLERETDEDMSALFRLLDEADDVVAKNGWAKVSVLSHAVQRGLCPYVQYRLTENPKVISTSKTPLLARALEPDTSRSAVLKSINVDMVRLLLTHGANPNASCPPQHEIGERQGPTTVWAELLLTIQRGALQVDNHAILFDVLLLLLANGAALDTKVQIRTEYHRRRDTGRAADLYKTEVAKPIYMTAEQILGAVVTRDEQIRLFSVSSKQSKRSRLSHFFEFFKHQ